MKVSWIYGMLIYYETSKVDPRTKTHLSPTLCMRPELEPLSWRVGF